MVFFIPWRVVAEESGAAHLGLGGAMLLDLPGPARRLLTDVADLHFSDIPVRGDDGARAIGAIDDDDDVGFGERRRWWRRRVAQRGSATYGVIDSDRQILQH